jgi:hypothetical protein
LNFKSKVVYTAGVTQSFLTKARYVFLYCLLIACAIFIGRKQKQQGLQKQNIMVILVV